jgi:hypothetical protein
MDWQSFIRGIELNLVKGLANKVEFFFKDSTLLWQPPRICDINMATSNFFHPKYGVFVFIYFLEK